MHYVARTCILHSVRTSCMVLVVKSICTKD